MAIQSNFPALKPSLMLDFANVKQLDPRITFTRASTATYYNGVTTAMAEQNLLLYSQQFDVADWTKTRATVTANATTAPDGTTTADSLDQLTGQTSYGGAIQSPVMPNATVFFSVYLKANTKTFAILRMAAQNTWFNLSTGAVGTVGSGITASIVSVGSGWYRCIISGNSFGNNQSAIFLADTDGSTTVTDSGGIYLWGAQLEQRSAVSAYTATTTQAITNYIPVLQTAASGVARFDNNPTTGESLGLLIEESRTNLLTYSSDFSNAAWVSAGEGGGLITAASYIAPDGTQTASKFYETVTTNAAKARGQIIALSATTYTITCFAKAEERSFFYFRVGINLTANNILQFFNLSTGAIGSTTTSGTGGPTFVSASMTSAGDGVYRCSFTFAAASATNYYTQIGLSNANGTFNYTGDGYSGIYIWGAQLELGAFATSYIPTVASQVTRAADSASMTGTNFSSWFNAGEGTLYTEALAPNASASVGIVELGNSVSGVYLAIYRQASTWRYRTSTANLNLNPQLTEGSFNKTAFGYSATSYPVSVNNTTAQTNTTTGLLSVNQLYIGYANVTASPLNGTIKKLAYYPFKVTNAQLQALTS
jgi:hypothetical protein